MRRLIGNCFQYHVLSSLNVGWRNFGRRSGGGGGGSSIRINTPERQQVPYANDIDNINMTNPILRRASIRRERIDSQKGRLKPWQ